ncbi:DNA-binding beta-propeller fold protein YncE [Caballeronia udeis]|uniref:DNA-binding beta-propeller fold protein YncE n=1 Tax=Caballeronia udeis TaxID=1232866 RepID=A0ABW8MPZ7_9BURK
MLSSHYSQRFLQRFKRQALTVASALTAAAVLTLSGCGSTQVASTPQRISLDARANGIAIRPADGAVFITDDKTNSVLSSADGKAFKPFASLPPVAGQANALSQVSMADDGSLLVGRFGFGTAGAVFDVDANRSVSILSGPDPVRRRLGLASIGMGKILSTWFVKNGSSPATGGLSLITYDVSTHAASEHNLLTGLAKPVGIAVQGDAVFISDQTDNMILKTSLSGLLNHAQAGGLNTTVIKINGPDLLSIDSSGTLYTKCNSTAVCRISPDESVTVIANDFEDARGVAVDPVHHLLYVIDRPKSADSASTLRTIPLN